MHQVPRISIQAAASPTIDMPPWYNTPRKGTKASAEELAAAAAVGSDQWEMLVPMAVLRPGYADTCKHYFEVKDDRRWTHIRVNYHPDGGVARLRCFGEVQRDWVRWLAEHPETQGPSNLVDLAAVENGGLGLMASNAHYGHPQNLVGLGRAVNMGDGWETARNPLRPPVFTTNAEGLMDLPGCEWCVLQLGAAGVIYSVDVDTLHFKGNYPESFTLEACFSPAAFSPDSAAWQPVMRRTRLTPHASHKFDEGTGNLVKTAGPVTHVRLTIYPDGGIARLRLWGRPAPGGRSNI